MDKLIKSVYNFIWMFTGLPDLPPKYLISLKPRINQYTRESYAPRYKIMADMWYFGISVEDIAKRYNVTRTRVRSCIWKCYYEKS